MQKRGRRQSKEEALYGYDSNDDGDGGSSDDEGFRSRVRSNTIS
jgi:hypothetical protein